MAPGREFRPDLALLSNEWMRGGYAAYAWTSGPGFFKYWPVIAFADQ